jgi:hypothetical protein
MRARAHAETGQASVELLAGAGALLVAALVALQLLAAGYAAVMADHAAEAGALALADGHGAAAAARSAVPGWPDGAIQVEVGRGTVVVTLAPPSPLGALRARLAARGRAVVRPPAGERRWDR